MKKKLLIIEDELALCFLMKTILESTDRYEVVIANDGKAGYDMCVGEKPALIFLDYLMPNENGDYVVRLLKKDDQAQNIPIVLMSGLGEEVYFQDDHKPPVLIHRITEGGGHPTVEKCGYHFVPRERALETGVLVYLPKPFSREALLEVAGKILSGFRGTQVP
jgi:CheY-like chemotaxis protein